MSIEYEHLLLLMFASVIGAASLLRSIQIYMSAQANADLQTLQEDGLVFLIEGERLVDASASAI